MTKTATEKFTVYNHTPLDPTLKPHACTLVCVPDALPPVSGQNLTAPLRQPSPNSIGTNRERFCQSQSNKHAKFPRNSLQSKAGDLGQVRANTNQATDTSDAPKQPKPIHQTFTKDTDDEACLSNCVKSLMSSSQEWRDLFVTCPALNSKQSCQMPLQVTYAQLYELARSKVGLQHEIRASLIYQGHPLPRSDQNVPLDRLVPHSTLELACFALPGGSSRHDQSQSKLIDDTSYIDPPKIGDQLIKNQKELKMSITKPPLNLPGDSARNIDPKDFEHNVPYKFGIDEGRRSISDNSHRINLSVELDQPHMQKIMIDDVSMEQRDAFDQDTSRAKMLRNTAMRSDSAHKDDAIVEEKEESSPSKSQSLRRSEVAGFSTDFQVGAFFSQIRKKKEEGLESNMFDTSQMKGYEYVDRLIQQQQDFYHGKYAFEKSQFHQCIPNPRQENQMITVQKVSRVLEGLSSQESAANDDGFQEGQGHEQSKYIKTRSQQYQRYNLVSTDKIEAEESDSEEAHGEDKTHALHSQLSGLQRDDTYGGNFDDLYKQVYLNETVDPVAGVFAKEYAKVFKSESQDVAVSGFMNCTDYAVIGFWDLQESDRFECTRFFIVPNPMVRNIRDCDGTKLDQILYHSIHTDDIFFFFRGYEEISNDSGTTYGAQKLQIAFLDLTENEKESVGDSRHIYHHCKLRYPIADESILGIFITELNETNVHDQEQMPNPTVIPTVTLKGPASQGKTVVFTAYMQEQTITKDRPASLDMNDQKPEKCWYPSVFFFDLEKGKTVWEIFGTEVFIRMKGTRVLVLTSDIWSHYKGQWYSNARQEQPDFSRHNSEYDFFEWMKYGTYPTDSQLDNRRIKAPHNPTLRYYKVNLGSNQNLTITENTKVVEAQVHNNGKKVTILYKGLGSYTFAFEEDLNLAKPRVFSGSYNKHKFNVELQFSTNRNAAWGEGQDEMENYVGVEIVLNPKNTNRWHGYFESEKDSQQIEIDALTIDEVEGKISANWTNSENEKCTISGTIDEKGSDYTGCKFALDDGSGRIRVFEGKTDNQRSLIKGTWNFADDNSDAKIEQKFVFRLKDKVQGNIEIQFKDETYTEDIELEYQEKFIFYQKDNVRVTLLDGIEAKDQAKLIYFILKPDVSFVRSQKSGVVQVQAKLHSINDDEYHSKGKGVTETTLALYDISADPKKITKNFSSKKKSKDLSKKGKGKGKQKKVQNKASTSKKTISEPPHEDIKFYLSQSYLQNQELKASYLGNLNNGVINSEGRYFGSIIYEEYITQNLSLNFFSTSLELEKEAKTEEVTTTLDYPQTPVNQSWIVDYPLLAYKTFTPRNREIAIINVVANDPQQIIHLGKWEFVSFVNHTQMVEQKLFKRHKETNCDIFFLVRKDDKIRLMSYKTNPWRRHSNKNAANDEDACKQSVYLFSGSLDFVPTSSRSESDNMNQFSRRFDNDKVQNIQLISKKLGSCNHYALIVQFNDCIAQASLNENTFEIICKPEDMVRRHMIRGYNDKIYFAESSGNVDKVQKLEFHSSDANEITKQEVFQLSGSSLMAFEPDGELMANDMEEGQNQSFIIMDSEQKIYFVENETSVRFEVKKVIDFAPHNILKAITAWFSIDWQHAHITKRTLSFGEKIYNLNSRLKIANSVPRLYFGEEQVVNDQVDEDEKISFKSEKQDESGTESEAEFGDEQESEDKWRTQSVQGMNLSPYMISQCQKSLSEFCFVVKPAPGSRQITTLGYKGLSEIQQMYFVSNNHVLIKLRGGTILTLINNGCIIHQPDAVQAYLKIKNSKIVGESQEGKKTLILEQKIGKRQDQEQHVALQFQENGLAKVVGIYAQTQKQMRKKIAAFAQKARSIDRENELNQIKLAKGNDQPKMDKPESKAERHTELNVKYVNDYFVTENSEIIKIAAMVSPHRSIREQAEQATAKTSDDSKRKTKQTTFSVFSIENSVQQQSKDEETRRNEFKVVVFHCKSIEEQTEIAENTQFRIVGDYLCQRVRNRKTIWVTKLKENDQIFVPPENTQDLESEMYYQRQSCGLNLKRRVKGFDLEQIQLIEVPKSSFKAIPSDGSSKLYNNLLQVTIGAHGIIFSLDDQIKEIDSIENIDSFQCPNSTVNTGFVLSSSQEYRNKKEKWVHRTQLTTNALGNFSFIRILEKFKSGHRFASNPGTLFRSYAEIDLFALKEIFQSIKNGQKIPQTDIQAILSTYEGHTVFSIFFDRIEVFDHILAQLQELEFDEEEDLNGNDAENNVPRKLYRILNLPTTKFLHKDLHRDSDGQAAIHDERQHRQKGSWWTACKRTKIENDAIANFCPMTQRSLYFENQRFLDSLMEIDLLCHESQITDFVQNQADIKILFDTMSPAVVAFFQEAFIRTRFTKQVKNLDWEQGVSLYAIGQNHSVITEKAANKIITQDKDAKDENIHKRQVEVRLLQIDWVFAQYDGKTTVGFRELLTALAQAPNESLFSTDFVQTLLKHIWDRYYYAILYRCFIPFVVYFTTTIFYISAFTADGVDPDERWSATPEFFMRWVILIGTVYFAFIEITTMLRDGFVYFKSMYNLIDFGTFVLNFYLTYATSAYPLEESKESRSTIRSLATLAVFLLWLKTFYWMRLFESLSFYVRLISETLYDIRFFLILFVFILMTFGNTLMIIGHHREESKGELYKNFFEHEFLNVIMNQYILSLGQFDLDNFQFENQDTLPWVFFIATTFIIQITFLNMLIAIMGDTFGRVSEIKEQSAVKEVVKIYSDYAIIVGRESEKNRNLFEYIFAIRRKTLASDENSGWEGTVSQISKALEKNSHQMKVNFDRKFTMIQNEQEAMASRLNDLDGKMVGLDGKISDQNGTISGMAAAMKNLPEQMRAVLRQEKKEVSQDLLLNQDQALVSVQAFEATNPAMTEDQQQLSELKE